MKKAGHAKWLTEVRDYQYHKCTYHIYLYRNPLVYFVYMIFDLAFKRVRHLFEPWH